MSWFYLSTPFLPPSLLTRVPLREEGKEKLHHVRVLVLLGRPVAVQDDGHLGREGGREGGKEGGVSVLVVLLRFQDKRPSKRTTQIRRDIYMYIYMSDSKMGRHRTDLKRIHK